MLCWQGSLSSAQFGRVWLGPAALMKRELNQLLWGQNRQTVRGSTWHCLSESGIKLNLKLSYSCFAGSMSKGIPFLKTSSTWHGVFYYLHSGSYKPLAVAAQNWQEFPCLGNTGSPFCTQWQYRMTVTKEDLPFRQATPAGVNGLTGVIGTVGEFEQKD